MLEPGSVEKKLPDICCGNQGLLSFQESKGPIRSTCQQRGDREDVAGIPSSLPSQRQLVSGSGLG